MRNLTTGKDIKRTYTDEELDQTFEQPESRKKPEKKEEIQLVPIRQKLNTKETIAQRREHRVIKRPVWQFL